MVLAPAVYLAAMALLQDGSSARPISLPPSAGSAPSRVAAATMTTRPPVIDGRDDDPIWQTVQPITAFLEWDPEEGKAPRFPTAAKVAYDEHNLYVFVRCFDPEPAKIQQLLARRDQFTPSDMVWVMIDSYHDRRSGYEFAVNSAGVKLDQSISNDGNEDDAWDGVWDVATTVDSLGWTAEYRIPFSQLRFANGPTHTFGFMIIRDIERYKERLSWPLIDRNHSGFVSQMGELRGIDSIPSPRRLEVAPYVVAKNLSVATATGFDRAQRWSGGADFKYGISSNLTLDGTVNPDFGQVEADPAVLNLSAFETFYREKRPFFIEGSSLLKFDVNCNVTNCMNEGLYYSRRIGRAPELSSYGDATSPTATTILGAGKLTGRSASGLQLGVLEVVTQRETGTLDRTIEPATNYAVVRAEQDLRGGNTGFGIIGTAVNRSLDQWSADSLHREAYVGGLDFRNRFAQERYQVSGSVTLSQVSGTAAAISQTQLGAVHYYQRPDGPLHFDSTRTALGGDQEQVKFGKVGGGTIQFETSWQRESPGYEINDLGYLQRADWQEQAAWVVFNFYKPTKVYKRLFWNFNTWNDWTAAGLPLEHALNTNAHTELANHWWLHAGVTAGAIGTAYCDRCARGGPALRRSPALVPWAGIMGDQRKTIMPSLWINYFRTDEGRSSNLNLNPQVAVRMSSRLSTTLGVNITWNQDHTQWYGNYTDSSAVQHYTFAYLNQQTLDFQFRVDYTMTKNLTLQVYAEPFVSKGTYSDVRELADPRAEAYADRFRPYGDTAITNNPGGVNSKQFNSNVVLRWEYHPGSTVYVVWTQGRSDYASVPGTGSMRDNFNDLFQLHPDNTFLIKVSHWFDW